MKSMAWQATPTPVLDLLPSLLTTKTNRPLHRAHGFNAIDLDALENRAREDQERQWQRDEFADLLDEFESAGGQADDLFAAVQAILDKQEKG